MADKYLNRDSTTGRVTEIEATVTGGTVSQAGDIPALDAGGRLDSTLMPVGVMADVFTGNAAEALVGGDFCYVTPTQTIAKASATSGGNDAMGYVLVSSASGQPATIYFEGRNTALTGLTPNTRYYLSDTTPGGVTATPVSGAGKRHQFLGRAVTSTTLSFEPDDSILLA